jgi:hypothetical protein
MTKKELCNYELKSKINNAFWKILLDKDHSIYLKYKGKDIVYYGSAPDNQNCYFKWIIQNTKGNDDYYLVKIKKSIYELW